MSISSSFYFVGDKMTAGCFKDEISPLLTGNNRIKMFLKSDNE